MFEKTTRIISENLARSLNRRSFLKRAGETAFFGMAALAAGQAVPRTARASGIGVAPPLTPSCSPPGPYCNLDGISQPSGCHGSACFQHLYQGTVYPCRVYYTYYQAGCWTTAVTGGYWTCCDCECLNGSGQRVATCGCAQFSGGPAPRPDSPSESSPKV